jgi:hypothetical protein
MARNYVNVGVVKGEYKNDDAIERVVSYILRLNNKWVGGVGLERYTETAAITRFQTVQGIYSKLLGIDKDFKKVLHFYMSFNKCYPLSITDVYEIAQEVAYKHFTGSQCIFAVHTDTGHLHVHFAVNTVTYDGKIRNYYDVEEMLDYTNIITELKVSNRIKQNGIF